MSTNILVVLCIKYNWCLETESPMGFKMKITLGEYVSHELASEKCTHIEEMNIDKWEYHIKTPFDSRHTTLHSLDSLRDEIENMEIPENATNRHDWFAMEMFEKIQKFEKHATCKEVSNTRPFKIYLTPNGKQK